MLAEMMAQIRVSIEDLKALEPQATGPNRVRVREAIECFERALAELEDLSPEERADMDEMLSSVRPH